MKMSLEKFNIELDVLLAAGQGSAGEVKKLEEGSHNAVVVGAITRTINDQVTGATRDVFELIFQIVDGDTKHYVRTKDMKLSLNEKSSYFEFLKKLLKVASPLDTNFIPRLKTIGIVKEGKLNLQNHFGLSVRLTLEDVVAKNGKSYLQIISVASSKTDIAQINDSIPEGLLMWDPTNEVVLAEGMTIKAKANVNTTVTNTPAVPATTTPKTSVVPASDDWLDA